MSIEKEKMSIEYALDPTSIESIKMYCFLRSIVKLPDGVYDEKVSVEKKAYGVLYTKMQSPIFTSHRGVQSKWFEYIYSPAADQHKFAIEVYMRIEKMLQWAK